jgi:hypothetical protein
MKLINCYFCQYIGKHMSILNTQNDDYIYDVLCTISVLISYLLPVEKFVCTYPLLMPSLFLSTLQEVPPVS